MQAKCSRNDCCVCIIVIVWYIGSGALNWPDISSEKVVG